MSPRRLIIRVAKWLRYQLTGPTLAERVEGLRAGTEKLDSRLARRPEQL